MNKPENTVNNIDKESAEDHYRVGKKDLFAQRMSCIDEA